MNDISVTRQKQKRGKLADRWRARASSRHRRGGTLTKVWKHTHTGSSAEKLGVHLESAEVETVSE